MKDKPQKKTRYGRVVTKVDGERQLTGMLEKGRFGPELRLVTNINGEWLNGRAIVYSDTEGNETRVDLPPFGSSVYLEDDV